jgi:hypothetical protein
MVSVVDVWKNKSPGQIWTLSPLHRQKHLKEHMFLPEFHALFDLFFIHVLIKLW